MPVEHIHTYLVHPRSGDASTEIGGTAVPFEGKLFNSLRQVYDKSDQECDLEISFNRRPDGTQQNDCRDLITAYVDDPNILRGRAIASKLEAVTTKRSGLGLLFLMLGREGLQHKLIVARFPADSGIMAEENHEELSVSFLEHIFMKSAYSYKSVIFKDASTIAGF